jgi:HAD superfamily hydrolase (TIGR01459 family)
MTNVIMTSARDLLPRYPVLFCDVWGVVHNGVREYERAGEALARYRAGGGIVVLLSNAPTPSGSVARVLAEKGVRRTAWDAIVSSGDVTRLYLAGRGFKSIYHIGPDRSLSLFDGVTASLGPIGYADAIVCTGLFHDATESGESYRPLLQQQVHRRLPFVCANPDLVVDVGGHLLPCAGAVASVYADLGGDVYWAGKPHAPAYELAFATAARIAGRDIYPADVLAIGDAVATDIAGAASAGIDAMFIGGGIHRDAVIRDGAIDAGALASVLGQRSNGVVGSAPALAW